MKIYTQTYDLAKASPHRFWVAPYSEFKIGIKLLEKDEISDKDFTLKAGSVEFTPDEDKIDNFTLFTIKSNDTGFVEYTIEVEGVAEKLKLMQIVTDSTVFEIDASGGDVPADVATQTWVNSQISDFVEEDELTAYATKAELTGYVENGDLTAYYTKSDTSSATEIGTALEGKQPAGNYLTAETEPAFAAMSADIVVDGDLTAYYTKSETSSATELADAFAGAGGGGAISAFDLSESPVWSKTQVEAALANNICLPQTVYQLKDGTIRIKDLRGTLVTNDISGEGVNGVQKILVGTNISSIDSLIYTSAALSTVVLPDSITNLKNNAFITNGSGNAVLRIPDSVSSLKTMRYSTYIYSCMDFGNTRKTVPALSWNSTDPDCVCYVPDALYDTWIAASNWSNISAQIHRHSELEAPYATSTAVSALTAANGKVTGGAETGTTGTPAAITAVKSVYETDWATLSAAADENTFYVVVPDPA